jgi:hypothetical protein
MFQHILLPMDGSELAVNAIMVSPLLKSKEQESGR